MAPRSERRIQPSQSRLLLLMVLAARPTLAEVPLADRSFATGSTIYAATSGGLSVGVVAVPEPSTYAMALAGLACGGFSMFRRRRAR